MAEGDSDLDSVGDTGHKASRQRHTDATTDSITEAEKLAAETGSAPEVSLTAASSTPASQSNSSVPKEGGSGEKGSDQDGFIPVGKKGKKGAQAKRAAPYNSRPPKSRG